VADEDKAQWPFRIAVFLTKSTAVLVRRSFRFVQRYGGKAASLSKCERRGRQYLRLPSCNTNHDESVVDFPQISEDSSEEKEGGAKAI
jgi:hypothetical protein